MNTCIGYIAGAEVSSLWVRCKDSFIAHNPEMSRHIVCVFSGPTMDKSRNLVVETFLNSEHNYDRLFMMDTDIAFKPADAAQLLSHDLPFVSGLYASQNGKRMAAFRWNPELGPTSAEWPMSSEYKYEPGLSKVAAVGMGFCVVKREVFEKIGGDWFTYMHSSGEDVSFCKRADEAGFDIWLDSDIRVGHVKPQVIYP
jgi:hypothetical protein